jgi:dihydrofolate reductase
MRIIIAAMSEDRVIGLGAGMPWHVPEEYAQYLDFIRDQTIILGRKSFDIFGDDLTSQHTIVVTRRATPTPKAHACADLDSAFALAESFGTDIYVAGGTSIYAQTLDHVDRMYLSYIKGHFEGDRHFPHFNAEDWSILERRDHPQFVFVAYENN